MIITRKIRQERIEMYKAYCAELDQYDEKMEKYPEGHAETVAKGYLNDVHFWWHPVEWDGQEIGFVISEKCCINSMISSVICEAYMLPEFRHMGIMRSTIHIMLENYFKDTVTLEIFDKNPARKFWMKIFDATGWKKLLVTPKNDGSGLRMYTFWRPYNKGCPKG